VSAAQQLRQDRFTVLRAHTQAEPEVQVRRLADYDLMLGLDAEYDVMLGLDADDGQSAAGEAV
jgi:hypothetical protein